MQPMLTQSPYPMISIAEAREIILARARPLPAEEIDFFAARGRVLARDVVAEEDLPSGPRAAVDGYAVRAQAGPCRLRVTGEIAAGHGPSRPLGADEAVRIMTGGLLPAGAEAVVMVEDTEERDGYVEIGRAVQPGANVHPPGQDVRRGQVVLRAGTRCGAPEIGMLATLGRVRVAVHRRPRVAVLSSGDEVVEPWVAPPPGLVRDSNRFALMAAVAEAGGEVVWHGHARDERVALERLVQEALEGVDVLLTSGGVSMGTRDLIKPLLARLGTVHFGRVAMKPGKPLTFVTIGERLVFGLPGFPVSSLVTFEVFVRPALLRLQGLRRIDRPRILVQLEREVRPDRVRFEYQRAVVRVQDGRFVATSTGLQSSSRLMSMLGANALLELEPAEQPLPAGAVVPALLIGEPES